MLLTKRRPLALATALALVLSMFALFPKGAFRVSADEEYELEVAGVKVTSVNKDDILGNGEASYKPEVKTLTLNKDIICNGENTEGATPCIVNRIEGLTVRSEGDIMLIRENFGAAIYTEKDITLNGKMTVRGGTGILATECTITIDNADITADGSAGGIQGGMQGKENGSKLIVNNSIVRALGKEFGAVSAFGGGIKIKSCAISTPGCVIGKDSIIDEGNQTAVEYVEITNSAIYNLRVAGVRVTGDNKDDILGNGEASYDPETNTLTLKKDITCDDEFNTGCVENNISGLTVKADERITLLRKNFGAAIVSGEDIILTGKMDINGGAGIMILESQLTIEDADFNINGSGWGIMGGLAGDGSKLIVRNSKLNITGVEDGAVVGFKLGVVLDGSNILSADCSVVEGTFCMGGDPEAPAKDVLLDTCDVYELEIAGVKVNGRNKDDILGNGEASYDPETNTLTIKKDIICNGDNTEGATPCIANLIDGLTVKSEGDVKLTRENFGAAIYSEKDMTITGKMTVTGGAGILVTESTLTVDDADLTVTGEAGGIQGGMPGKESGSKLVINNSAVHAAGGENGAISGFGGGVTLDGSVKISPDENDKEIIIEPELEFMLGDVNGDGSVNMKDLAALQRNVNGWGNEINLKNSDMNGDNTINMKDVAKLQRYLNGWPL